MLEQTKNEISNKGKVSKSAILDRCFWCFKIKKMSEVRFFSIWVVNYPIQEPFLSAYAKYGSWIFPWWRKFQQGEVLVVQAAYDFFACSQNAFYAASAKIGFRYLYKNFQKIPIVKNSGLTLQKSITTLIIFSWGANEKIFEAHQKLNVIDDIKNGRMQQVTKVFLKFRLPLVVSKRCILCYNEWQNSISF